MPRIPLIFPNRGLDGNVNFPAQAPDTSSDCKNVRVYDPILKRKRGGSRGGLSKWLLIQPNSTNRIQNLIKAVEGVAQTTGVAARTIIPVQTTVPDPDERFNVYDSSGSIVSLYTKNSISVFGACQDLAGNYYVSGVDGSDKTWKMNSSFVNQWTTTDGNSFAFIVYNEVQAEVVIVDTGNVVRSLATSNGASVWTFTIGVSIGSLWITPAGNVLVAAKEGTSYTGAGTSKSVFLLSGADGTLLASFTGGHGASDVLHASVNSQNEIVIVDPNAQCAGPNNDTVYYCDGGLNVIKQWNADAKPVDPSNEMWGLWDSKGNIIVVNDDGYTYSFKRDGTINWERDLLPAGVGAEISASTIDSDDTIHFAAETPIDWIDVSVDTIVLGIVASTGVFKYSDRTGVSPTEVAWMSSTGSKDGIATRNTRLTVVSGGSIYLVKNGEVALATSGSSALTTGAFDVQSVNAFSRMYFVDGTSLKKLILSTDTVSTWTAATAGTIPSLPRLITRYRGRVVLSGLVADPNNWFMSRAGDPEDWDYAPGTTDAIQAVAGNIGEVGLLGDIVTALIPYDDDAMVFGMDGSIAIMAGDPAAGGSIDVISNETGIAWDAWALDPHDTLYFMGIDGIYRMPRGGTIESITVDRLDTVFENIDLTAKRVLLEWDYLRRGLVVMIADVNDGIINDAFFWDSRTDGWLPEEYPVTMGPGVLLSFDGESINDKAFLMGCRDGYIRQIDPDATDDDGTTITSNVRFFPIGSRRGTDSRLYGLEVVLAEGSGNVTLKLYTGQTAEQCATGTEVRWSRLLTAGKNTMTLPRLSGAWLQIELAATTRWGLESIFGLFEEQGRSRRIRR